MSDVFLETTALIELAFGDQATVEKIDSLIPVGMRRISSQYVVYEMHRGFLRYMILTYNKTFQLERFSQLVAYVGNLRHAPGHMGAAIGSFQRYFQSSHPALTDEQQLIHYRGNMRRQIRRGLAKIGKSVEQIINDIGCRASAPPKEDDAGLIQFNPRMDLCGENRACGLKAYAAKWRSELEGIREYLNTSSKPDAETVLRIRGLRELYRNPKRDFDKGDCYRSGDALITHESAGDCAIITKNKKHIGPVCSHLKKIGIYY